MNFRSDNTAPIAPEILAAIGAANDGAAPAYSEDTLSRDLDGAFSEVFEREVRIFTVASGTAANALALASLTPPWGSVLCHAEAHIECDECGATEFYSGGAKLALAGGAHAKITAVALEEAAARNAPSIHAAKPSALSVTQATERGAVYTPEEIAQLTGIARREQMRVHMDGARFANAVASLGCAPADITWRAGVDVLSFGATKNGAMAAEAVVLFDLERAGEVARRRKRAGHLLSKGRFVAAQLHAYLKDGLWLRLAQRSNALAKRLGESAGAILSAPVQTNQVFIKPGVDALAKLRAAGVDFYEWGREGSGEVRLVVSWNQSEAEVDALCDLLSTMR